MRLSITRIIFLFIAINNLSHAAVEGLINAIVLQLDSKIIATGYDSSDNSFQTARYNSDGSLDESFGNNGAVATQIGSSSQANGVALQTDGSIVVAGYAVPSDVEIALARYDSSGVLDSSFGVSGVVTTPIADGSTASAVALQDDGNIVVAGVALVSGTPHIALARYDTAGALDTSFGINGIVTTLIDSGALAYSVAIQTDGKIVVGGLSVDGSSTNFTVARYTTSGSLDTAAFGSGNGYVTTSITGSDIVRSVAIQTDGSIIASGYSSSTPNSLTIARYTDSGVLDTSFGSGGIVMQTEENGLYSFDGLVQSDDAITVTGSLLTYTGNEEFATLRYLNDGSVDTSFGTGGAVFTAIQQNAGSRTIVQQNDTKLVVAGYSQINSITYFTLARYLLDGTLDQSFGVGGIAGPLKKINCCTGSTGATGATGNTGAQGIQGNTGATGPVPAAANFIFAYDTTTQLVSIADTFQNLNYSTNELINNWQHTGGTALFTCPADGTYTIDYQLLANNTDLTASGSTVSARVLLNGTEIPGSQSSITMGALLGQLIPLHQSFLVNCSTNDQITVQFTGTSTNNQITANNGSGTVRPSATIVITKL